MKRIPCPNHISGWPAAVLALMSSIRLGKHGAIRFGVVHLGITEDNAWTLHEAFEARAWDAPAVEEILRKVATAGSSRRKRSA